MVVWGLCSKVCWLERLQWVTRPVYGIYGNMSQTVTVLYFSQLNLSLSNHQVINDII